MVYAIMAIKQNESKEASFFETLVGACAPYHRGLSAVGAGDRPDLRGGVAAAGHRRGRAEIFGHPQPLCLGRGAGLRAGHPCPVLCPKALSRQAGLGGSAELYFAVQRGGAAPLAGGAPAGGQHQLLCGAAEQLRGGYPEHPDLGAADLRHRHRHAGGLCGDPDPGSAELVQVGVGAGGAGRRRRGGRCGRGGHGRLCDAGGEHLSAEQ